MGRGRRGGEEVVFEGEEGEEVFFFLHDVVQSTIADTLNAIVDGAAAEVRGRESNGGETTAE